MSLRESRHALVVGGSMAGLLAARALAEHFDHVMVVERDPLPEGPDSRAGVPQARHLHVLLMRGQAILQQYFPGLGDELVAMGAVRIDSAADLKWLTPAGWGVRFPSDLSMLACSRDLLEWGVRRQLMRVRGIHFLEEREVTGLATDGQRKVLGIIARRRGVKPGAAAEERLDAALVVDASGRRSCLPEWLESMGLERPPETVISAHLGYASRVYRRPAGFQADWKGVYLQAAPPERTRIGVLGPIEGDRWLLSLGGGDRDYPPTDEVGFMQFIRSLPSPEIYEAVRRAEPLSPISGFRDTANRLRHYERLSRFPDGLVVLGDAACAFNPVYGQGMTTAAMGAAALDQCLREQEGLRPDGDLRGLSRRFQQRLARVTAVPWMLATSEDYRYRGTTGPAAAWNTRLMHRYLDEVTRLTTRDPAVRRAFLEAFHLIQPPSTLFQPGILRQVLQQLLDRRSRLEATAIEAELARSA